MITKNIKEIDKEHFAKVDVHNLTISTKKSVEICNFIRNKNLNKTKSILTQVLNKKIAVPVKRFNKDRAHKPGRGIAAGFYPIKTVQEFLRLLNSLEANALQKGLDVNNLVVYYAISNQGPKVWHSGRQRRRKMKITHIELRAKEREKK
ncbi:MAG TPA: 50S ribosomal protein L22 [Candidatus Nanoarchaeia archaeon]|nr:50S ribosomal protein L22 [Candidatus Nanoarchaeia archaeon]